MEKKSISNINVAYLGEDEPYLHKLSTQFKKIYPNLNITFFEKKVNNNVSAFRSIADLVGLDLDLIYIDYSLYSESYLKLAKFLKDQTTTRDIPLIGLSGLNNTHEEFYSGLIAGFNVIYNKSIEVTDAVFHGMKLACPEKAKVQKVALVDHIKFPLKALHFFRIGYLTQDYIHVECNLKLEIGEEVFISGGIVDELKGNKFKVIRNNKENFYYNFKFSYDLEFVHPNLEEVIEIEELESLSEEEKAKKINKLETKLKKEREEWLKNKIKVSVGKRIKVIFFDEDLKILRQTKKEIDNFPYSLRVHQFMDNEGQVIKEVMPSIIVFCKKKSSTLGDGFLPNNLTGFQRLIELVKKSKGFSPFIIIFNEEEDLSVLKQDLNYDRILPIKKDFSLQLTLEIIKSFEEKEGRLLTHDPSLSFAKKEKRYYLDKNDLRSIVKSEHPIEIYSMSETFFSLMAPSSILEKTVIKIEDPFEMGLTLIGKDSEDKSSMALVNGISSKNMAELRQLINRMIQEKKDTKEEE